MADLGPLGHPDHLRVLLAASTRRPCLAPSIIARESLFPSAQGGPDQRTPSCAELGRRRRFGAPFPLSGHAPETVGLRVFGIFPASLLAAGRFMTSREHPLIPATVGTSATGC